MTTKKEEIIKESMDFIKKNVGYIIDKEDSRANSYISPRLSSEFMDCSMPMTFDHYSYCHPPDTMIEMANGGSKRICDVKVGDSVLSYSIDKQQIVENKVLSCLEREVQSIIQIQTNENDVLELTEDHPVYIKTKGWVEAKHININNIVLKINVSQIKQVKIIGIRIKAKKEKVYNLQVDHPYENFFANKLLVHNCSLSCQYCVIAGTQILMATGRQKVIERITVGEGIITYNETTKQFETSIVTETMINNSRQTFIVNVNNKKLTLTAEHPIFVKDKGWVEAKDLNEDDEVMVW